MRTDIPSAVVRAVQREREMLVAKREELVVDLDRQIAEIDLFLAGRAEPASTVPPAAASPAAEFNSKTIVACAERIIAAKQPATWRAIRDLLAKTGVPVPADEEARVRINKALWRTGRFRGLRDKGWLPKGEAPPAGTADGASVQLGL